MQRLKRIRIDIFLIFLVSITIFLCYQNYMPHTILSGWDTLHPEFNFTQYLTRITSVWQEHQGLGAPPSQAHAAEIPRMLIYSILLLIFPFDFVRYSYIFLMIIMGPVGVYLFLRYLFHKEQVKPLTSQVSAFLGGLFYLLNLGTMQHFIVVLEMFATKFGFLGFIYLFVTKFLDTGRRKDLLLLLFFTLFASSMAHTATLWYVFYFGIVLYIGVYTFFHTHLRSTLIKRGAGILIALLVINLFWILPNLYYSFSYGPDIITAKIHRLFSQEAYLNNKAYGDIANFLLLKNFLFNWKVLELTHVIKNDIFIATSTDLLQSWKLYLEHIVIQILGYLFTFVALAGSVLSVKKKNPYLISLLPITIITVVFLLSNVPVFAQLFDFLRESSDFLKEGLRFPFTKLSLYLIFSLAIFFAFAHMVLLRKFAGKFIGLYFFIFTAALIFYSWPAFTGNYISSVIKVQIPREYYDLFDWSQNAKQGRMLELPLQSLYGWVVYDWSGPPSDTIYQGAGFTWFGLKQPLLNREFDRWYPYNEQNYRELSYALYSENASLFEALLHKYNITYILVDQNVFNSGTQNEARQHIYSRIDTLLSQVKSLHLSKQFGSYIKVYEFVPTPSENAVFIINNPLNVSPSYRWGYVDQAYVDYGDYISMFESESDTFQRVLYPTRNILTEKERINTEIINLDTAKYTFILPEQATFIANDIFKTEKEIFTDIYIKRQKNQLVVLLEYLLPYGANNTGFRQEFVMPEIADTEITFALNDKVIRVAQRQITEEPIFLGETTVSTQKTNTLTVYNTERSDIVPINIKQLSPYACSEQKEKQLYSGGILENDSFILEAQGVKVCSDIKLTDVFNTNQLQRSGLFNIQLVYKIPKNTDGEFCLYDKAENSCSQHISFPSFIDTEKEISQFLSFSTEKLNNLFFRFSLDGQDASGSKDLLIQDIRVSLFPEAGRFRFLPTVSNDSQLAQQSSSLIGGLPQEHIDITAGHMTRHIKDCGLNPAKFLDKKVHEGVVTYTSLQGILCDVFVFPNLSQSSGYLVSIDSKNLQGLPLRICMQDTLSNKCFIEDELSQNKDFGPDYFILPPYNNPGGYNLILTNISIGNLSSVNEIKGISIIPFPFAYFQAYQSGRGNGEREETQRESTDFTKYAPYYYSTVVDRNTIKENEVLVLDQAYEKNWRASLVPSWIVENPLLRLFAPLFGSELKDHVLVNNWANGWVINPSNLPKEKQQLTVAIIFWPQVLQYFGFALLPLPFVYALWPRKRNSKSLIASNATDASTTGTTSI